MTRIGPSLRAALPPLPEAGPRAEAEETLSPRELVMSLPRLAPARQASALPAGLRTLPPPPPPTRSGLDALRTGATAMGANSEAIRAMLTTAQRLMGMGDAVQAARRAKAQA